MALMLIDSDSYQIIAVGLIVGSGPWIYFYFAYSMTLLYMRIHATEREAANQYQKQYERLAETNNQDFCRWESKGRGQ